MSKIPRDEPTLAQLQALRTAAQIDDRPTDVDELETMISLHNSRLTASRRASFLVPAIGLAIGIAILVWVIWSATLG